LRAFAGSLAAARPDGLTFRPVADVDQDFAFDLYAMVRAAELAPVPWPEEEKRRFLRQQAALQHRHYVANYPGADLLLIERDSAPIGRVYVYRTIDEIRLMDIALVPERRNRGIGTALIREILDEARATRRKVTLHVEPDNPAQRLYARLGFRLIEHRGVYDFLGWSEDGAVS
jgi:ribosomal protein S18 acetylase RimI-like enzyme